MSQENTAEENSPSSLCWKGSTYGSIYQKNTCDKYEARQK